jgi:hypothetical protein
MILVRHAVSSLSRKHKCRCPFPRVSPPIPPSRLSTVLPQPYLPNPRALLSQATSLTFAFQQTQDVIFADRPLKNLSASTHERCAVTDMP